MRIRMRGYKGGIADVSHVPEPAFVEVRQIDQNSQPIAGANQLFTEVGQTGASIGRRGTAERHAVPERIRSAPNWAERTKSRRIQNVQQLEIRVYGFRAFDMKNSCQHVTLQALSDFIDTAANSNSALRLPLDTEQKREHAEYSRLRCRQFNGGRDQGVPVDVSRRRFVVGAGCSIARRHENREQAPGKSSLTRHGKIQLALGPSFEECPGGVCSAAPVKTQQDVIVTVEDGHPPRRCHKRRVPLQIFTMRPSADRRLGVPCWVRASLAVLEAARVTGIKRVVVSSSSVLNHYLEGGEDGGDFGKEEAFPRPTTFYAATKQAVENLGLNYAKWCGIEFAGLRYGAVFGPWSGTGGGGPSNVVREAMRSALAGREAVLPPGAMEWVYSKDAARGTVMALG